MPVPASQVKTLPTLTSKHLPLRVRDLLKGILVFTSKELESSIVVSLDKFEQQLFNFAEQSHSDMVQTRWLEARRLVRHNRAELVPRFLSALQAELAILRDSPDATFSADGKPQRKGELALVEERNMDESRVLLELSSRAKLGNSLSLYLLGHRFGVLAGRPAFDADTLPIGPQALWRSMRSAANCLELSEEHRLMFFRIFDAQLVPFYGSLLEAANNYLVKNRVLPHLQYVPVRTRPSVQRSKSAPEEDDTKSQSNVEPDANPKEEVVHQAKPAPPRPSAPKLNQLPELAAQLSDTARGEVVLEAEGGLPAIFETPVISPQHFINSDRSAPSLPDLLPSEEGFHIMRQLLAGRRDLLDKLSPGRVRNSHEQVHVASPTELQRILGNLQADALAPVTVNGRPAPRTISHLKQEMLAMLQQTAPANTTPALPEEDGDAIDLVDMLFDSIIKDVKPNGHAASLISKLQVPLLRVALQDKAFFTSSQHPARRIFNSLADTATYCLNEEGSEETLIKVNSIVNRIVHEFNGNLELFNTLQDELDSHLQMVAYKAEVAERRHIEAARGKEKLALARERAASAVEALLKDKDLPRFIHTLLSQSWTDVMALTALRRGEDSETWKQQLAIAERLIQIACTPASEQMGPSEVDASLQLDIEQALSQVGYQADEASAIANRLVNPQTGTKKDVASRTELTMQLKACARLGVDIPNKKVKKIPLTPEEQARFEQLTHVAFGTWFEFLGKEPGDKIRRRLAWFSTVSGHVLFVNYRGQKNNEYTLERLAKLMVEGKIRIVEAEKISIIDRAWNSVMNALRSFAGQTLTENPV